MPKRGRRTNSRCRRGMPETVCDGFIVETDREDPVAAVAVARAALRRLVGDHEGWRVKPLAPGRPDLDLSPPPAWQPRTPGVAFEIARQLERQRHLTSAEPTFVAPGLVDPSRLPATGTGRRALTRSGGGAVAVNPDCEWSLKLTHVRDAWDLPPPAGGRAYGEGIVVAHPDTGYTTHPEIWEANPAQRRVRDELGFDYVECDQSPLDELDSARSDHGDFLSSFRNR